MKYLVAIVLFMQVLVVPVSAEVWEGTEISFEKANFADWTLAVHQDRITDAVWITRQATQGIFNILVNPAYSSPSPVGTQWAFEGLNGNPSGAEFSAANPVLVFSDWATALGGTGLLQGNVVGTPGILRLDDGSFIPIEFTSWQSGTSGGGFSYVRNTRTPENAFAVPSLPTIAVLFLFILLITVSLARLSTNDS